VTHTYIQAIGNQRSTTSREASAAQRLRANGKIGKLPCEVDFTDYPTYRVQVALRMLP